MKKTLIIAVVLSSLAVTTAYADVEVTYLDDVIHWDGYPDTVTPAHNLDDVVGLPDILSMDVHTSGTSLTKVDINYGTSLNTLSGFFDSLFINLNGTQTEGFEYYIKSTLDTGILPDTYTLYNVSGLTSSDYTLTNDTYSNVSSVRADHPNSYTDTALASALSYDVTSYVTVPSSITAGTAIEYDFAAMASAIGAIDNFTINGGYAISYMNSCANDVIVGATPIPAPFLLFGSALFSILGFRKLKS